MNSISVSIVISTYNRKKWVENLLASIALQSVQAEEIVIVDSSTEDIRYTIPPGLIVRQIKSERAQLTYQRNLGVRSTSGDIILHIDDDTSLDRDYIKNISHAFKSDTASEYGVIGGYVSNQWGLRQYSPSLKMRLAKLLRLYDGDFTPGSASRSGMFIELTELEAFNGLIPTDFISGCSFAVRRDVYNTSSHPEDIRFYGEDKLFSLLIAKDWKIGISGDSKLEHYSAQTGSRESKYKEMRASAHFLIYALYYYGDKHRLFNLRLFILYSATYLLLVGCLATLSIFKAKSSKKWITAGLGYLIGAFSRV